MGWLRGAVVSALGSEAVKLSLSRHLGAAAKWGDYPPATHSVQAENCGWRLQLSVWMVKPKVYRLCSENGEPISPLALQVPSVTCLVLVSGCRFSDSKVRGLKIGVS